MAKRKKSSTSPTQLTLKLCKELGYRFHVAEYWNPWARRRIDGFGFCDVEVLNGGPGTLYVQTTTTGSVSARVHKMEDLCAVYDALRDGNRVEIWGWAKRGPRGQRKVWTLTRRVFNLSGNRLTIEVADASSLVPLKDPRRQTSMSNFPTWYSAPGAGKTPAKEIELDTSAEMLAHRKAEREGGRAPGKLRNLMLGRRVTWWAGHIKKKEKGFAKFFFNENWLRQCWKKIVGRKTKGIPQEHRTKFEQAREWVPYLLTAECSKRGVERIGVLDAIAKKNKGKNVLIYGAGVGTAVYPFAKYNCNVTVVEVAKSHLMNALLARMEQDGIEVEVESVPHLGDAEGLADGPYDVIVCLDVLDRIDNFIPVLHALADRSKKGTKWLVSYTFKQSPGRSKENLYPWICTEDLALSDDYEAEPRVSLLKWFLTNASEALGMQVAENSSFRSDVKELYFDYDPSTRDADEDEDADDEYEEDDVDEGEELSDDEDEEEYEDDDGEEDEDGDWEDDEEADESDEEDDEEYEDDEESDEEDADDGEEGEDADDDDDWEDDEDGEYDEDEDEDEEEYEDDDEEDADDGDDEAEDDDEEWEDDDDSEDADEADDDDADDGDEEDEEWEDDDDADDDDGDDDGGDDDGDDEEWDDDDDGDVEEDEDDEEADEEDGDDEEWDDDDAEGDEEDDEEYEDEEDDEEAEDDDDEEEWDDED